MYGIRHFAAVHERNTVCGPRSAWVSMARGSVTRTRSVLGRPRKITSQQVRTHMQDTSHALKTRGLEAAMPCRSSPGDWQHTGGTSLASGGLDWHDRIFNVFGRILGTDPRIFRIFEIRSLATVLCSPVSDRR